MFIQTIQGKVADPEAVHAALDQWAAELAPGAIGWLGTTAGVTEDGSFIALGRFESAEAASRNSARPEQDQWWARTAALFSGEASFQESSDVMVDMVGDPGRAGFVQVIQGRGSDPDRARELMTRDSDKWAAFRPDVLGTVTVLFGGDAYTSAVYFTSEAEAREGERKEPPPELKAQMDELMALSTAEPQFFDLKHPWLYAPG